MAIMASKHIVFAKASILFSLWKNYNDNSPPTCRARSVGNKLSYCFCMPLKTPTWNVKNNKLLYKVRQALFFDDGILPYVDVLI